MGKQHVSPDLDSRELKHTHMESKHNSKRKSKDQDSKKRKREETDDDELGWQSSINSKKKKTQEVEEEIEHNSADSENGMEEDDTPDDSKPLSQFRIEKATIETLEKNNIKYLFPIQWRCFDAVYEGKDLIGRARTGSGKTLSFVLPVLERLIAYVYGTREKPNGPTDLSTEMKPRGSRRVHMAIPKSPRVLILAPTRELARQVNEVVHMVGSPHGISSLCVYGGAVYDPQVRSLNQGVDVVVGTPGRLIDHLERKNISLDHLHWMVLDEADEMLNVGFQVALESILEYVPKNPRPQTLLYSATLPDWVGKIAAKYLSKDRELIDIVGELVNKTSVTVRHLAIKAPPASKINIICDLISVYGGEGTAIIFCDTKNEANELGLSSQLATDCQVLHGDIVQSQREVTLQAFRDKRFRVLVATDVAARGLDIDHIDLVIQMKPPNDVETYIHRSGRTGRAGRSGICCLLYMDRMVGRLRSLEHAAGIKFERIGAPQPHDMYKVAGDKAVEKILNVSTLHPALVAEFEEAAQQLLQDVGSDVSALASALAVASGFSKPISGRSLLGAQEGKISIRLAFPSGSPIRSKSQAIRKVVEALSPKDNSGNHHSSTPDNFLASAATQLGIGEIRLTIDGAAILDVPSDMASKLTQQSNRSCIWEIITALPELVPEERPSFGDNRGRQGFNRGGHGGYGNRGGFSSGNRGGPSRGGYGSHRGGSRGPSFRGGKFSGGYGSSFK